jgi:hypothetical protein
MNYWKIVWDAYYQQATRRAYLRELVRLANWPTRIAFMLALGVFCYGLLDVIDDRQKEWPWLMIVGELSLLAIVEHVRTTRFATAYGSVESSFGPAEKEDQRGHRFLMFKNALQAAHLTENQVQGLFDIVEAKEELESQHNLALNKFVVFVSGFLTAAAITLISDLEAEQAAWLMFWVSLSGLTLAPLFWMLPTRKSRLKELKYFMVLYCKNMAAPVIGIDTHKTEQSNA